MKKIRMIMLSALICFALLSPSLADEVPPSGEANTVFTCAELLAWVDAHADSGGTVSLGADILWEAGVSLQLARSDITVEMGTYRIIIPGGAAVNPSGLFTFRGEADGLFLIEEGGALLHNAPVEINAHGDGSTAVRVMWPNGLQSSFATITAIGTGAIAVDAPNGLELLGGVLHAEGDGAAAIASGGPVRITYSEITAAGEGAKAIRTEAPVTLDTALVSPAIEGAETVSRAFDSSGYQASAAWNRRFYTQPGEVPKLPEILMGFLPAADGQDFSLSPDIIWDTSAVDVNTPGQHPCTGELVLPLPNISLEGAERLNAYVYVVDFQLPHIINYKEGPPGRGVIEQLVPTGDTAVRELWCSGDSGSTWTRIPLLANPMSNSNLYFDSPFVLPGTFWFQLVVRDEGTVMSSNILEVTLTDEGFSRKDIGGERQGTDRGEGIERPQPPDLGGSYAPEEDVPLESPVAPPPDQPTFSPSPRIRKARKNFQLIRAMAESLLMTATEPPPPIPAPTVTVEPESTVPPEPTAPPIQTPQFESKPVVQEEVQHPPVESSSPPDLEPDSHVPGPDTPAPPQTSMEAPAVSDPPAPPIESNSFTAAAPWPLVLTGGIVLFSAILFWIWRRNKP